MVGLTDHGQRRSKRTLLIVGVLLLLLIWPFVELILTSLPKAEAPPGTTFRAATEADAQITPTNAPADLPAWAGGKAGER